MKEMTNELKKKIKEELDARMSDILFERPKKAMEIMGSVLRAVLLKQNIPQEQFIVVPQRFGNEVWASITFVGGKSYECKIVSESVSFDELLE